jgi:hypothetical protein
MVAAIPNYSPLQLEALVTSLERLAPGRVVLGAGLGDEPGPHRAGRLERFEAGLQAVRAANPGVPVWLGAADPLGRPAAVRRAGAWQGLFPMGTDRPVEEVKAIARAIPMPTDRPFDLAMGVSWLAQGKDEEIRHYEDAGVTWLIETILPWVTPPEAAATRVKELRVGVHRNRSG